MDADAAHAARCERLLARLRAAPDAPWRLGKRESNLFRDRAATRRPRLDLSEFTHLIALGAGWVDVEGCMPYDALVEATLPHGVVPEVVPQLKSITVGGAISGVGIEASSFRHGLVHHTVQEIEVLLADGRIVVAGPDNEHAELFRAFPNSYGTLGYALRARLRTRPAKLYVSVRHLTFGDAAQAFGALERCCDDAASDFVDGVVFDASRIVISVARFVDAVPWTSDYRYEQIYYRSLLERSIDHLTARDYVWRWDTDWFWCSKNFGLQQRWLRRLAGPKRLNSRTYSRWMRWNARWGLTRRWARVRGRYRETVIQDVDLPLERAHEFLQFLLREIGIVPIWICPLRAPDAPFALYPLQARALYVNFGFWDVVTTAVAHELGHFNRLIEREVARLGGIKSLYSDSFYTREEFDATYGMAAYRPIKLRYDPDARLGTLYDKCVLRA